MHENLLKWMRKAKETYEMSQPEEPEREEARVELVVCQDKIPRLVHTIKIHSAEVICCEKWLKGKSAMSTGPLAPMAPVGTTAAVSEPTQHEEQASRE